MLDMGGLRMTIFTKEWGVALAFTVITGFLVVGIYKLVLWLVKIIKKVFDKLYPLSYKEKEN